MVRIPGFHPGGPGSIPGMGTFFSSLSLVILFFVVVVPVHIHLNFFLYHILHHTTTIGCYDGCVYCLKSDNGGIGWRIQLSSEPVKSSACVDEAMAWVGSHDHHLYGIDVKVGCMACCVCLLVKLCVVMSVRWGVLCTRCFLVEALVSHLPALILTEVWSMLPHFREQLQQLIRWFSSLSTSLPHTAENGSIFLPLGVAVYGTTMLLLSSLYPKCVDFVMVCRQQISPLEVLDRPLTDLYL